MNQKDDLYREQLLDLYKNPSNMGNMVSPTVAISSKNPFCGDTLDLQLKIDGNTITDAKFSGQSCFVTIASASLVTEEIIGKKIEFARKLTEKDVLDLLAVDLTTSRVKCATLILSAINSALDTYERK